MLDLLKDKSNFAFTQNGALTRATTGSECLDLFATIGALRNESEHEILIRFMHAFLEDRDAAMKILFFARDVREGLGERRIFRTIYHWLGTNYPKTAIRNIAHIAEFGRFDDLLALMDTPCELAVMDYIKELFNQDMERLSKGEPVSLLGKWLPSVNASNKVTITYARRIAKYLGLRDCEYRKALVALRRELRIIENNLRERDYTFDYSKQPSNAMFKYRVAFLRNDRDRYEQFLDDVFRGKTKLNATNVAPYELVRSVLNKDWYSDSAVRSLTESEKTALNCTWESLPDYECGEDILPVIDTSGSMYWYDAYPAAVALSLAIYFAEHNKGRFAGHFIEFSNTPQLIEVKGENFIEKLQYVSSFSQVANTNIHAVFNLILDTAIEHKLPQSELPAKIVIVSDMEFDSCASYATMTFFDAARKTYARFGYKLPEIVFWNVNSMSRHQPVRKESRGVTLVSGVTPKLFEMVAGDNLNPYQFMMEVLGKERYQGIVA